MTLAPGLAFGYAVLELWLSLGPGIKVIKLYSFITDAPCKYARVFSPCKSLKVGSGLTKNRLGCKSLQGINTLAYLPEHQK